MRARTEHFYFAWPGHSPYDGAASFSTGSSPSGRSGALGYCIQKETNMPTMSDNRRRRIVARQRKLENAKKREAKVAKKERNA